MGTQKFGTEFKTEVSEQSINHMSRHIYSNNKRL